MATKKSKTKELSMNGNVIETLRDMSNSEKLDPAIAQPIILGVLADIYQAICDLRNERESDWSMMESNRESYKEERAIQMKLIEDIKQNVIEVKSELDELRNVIGEIKHNPAISLGDFVYRYPNATKLILVVAIVIFSLWAIPGIRLWIFQDMLHLPPVVVDFLMANPTATPLP